MINPINSSYIKKNLNVSTEQVSVGDYTYGVPTILTWGETSCLKVGKFCSVSDKVEIYLGGEHWYNFITSFPLHHSLCGDALKTANTKGDVVIGNDVWIGRGVTILSGVTIGDGAVIGARAVVAKNILPYAVVIGNPARHIKFRFTDDQIVELLKIKWWDWDYKKIIEYTPLLESDGINEFIKRAKNDCT